MDRRTRKIVLDALLEESEKTDAEINDAIQAINEATKRKTSLEKKLQAVSTLWQYLNVEHAEEEGNKLKANE